MTMMAQKLTANPDVLPIREYFFRWQCRIRQIAMRENEGQPTDGMMPDVTLKGAAEPVGHIITIISKSSDYSKTPEMQHLVRQTLDPAKRREKALQLLCEAYYQRAYEFSDMLTASFSPRSPGAKSMSAAGSCTLSFDAYGQKFDLPCTVEVLDRESDLFQATWWHNNLFNPYLPAETVILGFLPDWGNSTASPQGY